MFISAWLESLFKPIARIFIALFSLFFWVNPLWWYSSTTSGKRTSGWEPPRLGAFHITIETDPNWSSWAKEKGALFSDCLV